MTTIRVANRERWTSISRSTINDDRLSFRARGILAWILDKPDGWSTDSVRLAREASEGRDAVRTALKELETFGYLVRSKRQTEKGQWVTDWDVHERPPDDWKSGVGSPVVGEPGAKEKTEPITESTTEETPLPPAVDGQLDVLEPWEVMFIQFWESYPRKIAKPAARKSFKAKVSEMTAPQMELMIDGTNAWMAHWIVADTEEQFIPHPATFLNQERYNDHPPRTAPPSKQSAVDIINRIAQRDQ